ncbi:MAG: amino acid permease [Bacteroidales bacterium]|nr:amino acid permease [Bacteroidales bacterium]
MSNNSQSTKRFGTAPVFFTAISTILGAIIFLRFGFAVGTLGFWGVVLIIVVGHAVTIPTALAISEIATNKRVEGGGEYFIISRSFGLNIGGTIGIALFLSQAISVAFYIIAFTEAFEFLFTYLSDHMGWDLPRQIVSIPAMLGLGLLILKKGAAMGVKTLYIVVLILAFSLVMFFLGKPFGDAPSTFSLADASLRNTDQFFFIFAIIFPAFTGMTAGVGLSGDLKNPAKSIPRGTVTATVVGMIMYIFIIWKLAGSASPQDLLDHQLIMGKIALGGAIIIPLGLAASTISSAIGSILVAPRTLQALASDHSLPGKALNRWLSKGRGSDNEPYNATLITSLIAFVFIAVGNVNAVAEIISMFFMVTYGSLCLISFLNHFGSSPSYRPSFKSRWYFSLIGFFAAIWIMFKINTIYALAAIVLMMLIYLYLNHYHKNRQGLSSIFMNSLFQLNRNLQVFLQKKGKKQREQEWRPSAICISSDSFIRQHAFEMLNWLSYKYGFGTYIHLINGYYGHAASEQSALTLDKLRKQFDSLNHHVYLDTLISPSYTSAIAQSIQIPGISGMENNMLLFEFDKDNPLHLSDIITNLSLVHSGDFDLAILGSSSKKIKYKNGIHIWIRKSDYENANLMILLSFIILGHPDWKKANIRIFEVYQDQDLEATKERLDELILTGRLPITKKNLEWIHEDPQVSFKDQIKKHSADAALTLIGVNMNSVKHKGTEVFSDLEGLGNILFINSHKQIEIE